MSLNKLTNILKNIVGDGGEYLALNDLIANYPEGVTINGVSLRDGKEIKNVPCFTFAEDSTKYFYAVSGDLHKIYTAWMNACGNNIETLNEALNGEFVKVVISKTKTKSNKTYVKVRYIETILASEYSRIDAETGEIKEINETGENAKTDKTGKPNENAKPDEDNEDVEVPF